MLKRKDGTLVTGLDSVHKIMPFLMKERCESEVSYTEKFDVTELLKYINDLNEDKEIKITLFHAIITALSKTIYNRPLLNRFVAGKRFYDRNELTFSFVAKNKFEDKAEERLLILKINKDMNLEKISEKIANDVSKTRKKGSNNLNDTLNLVTMWPRSITSFIVWCFRKLDFYGLVPESVSKTDPNYSSVLISNLGSIKGKSAYHHLNNYGTNSMVVTVGVITKENIIDEKGKVQERDIVDICFTIDERIADGFYFIKSIKLFKNILEDPELINREINEVINNEKTNS